VSTSVKPGYKLTEVGVIPEDWEVKRLKEISPAQSVGLVINPSWYFEDTGTVPMLVGSNIRENSIAWDSARRISDASNLRLPASRLAAGDLVTVRVGEPGVTAVIPPQLDGCNCASVMIVRQDSSFNSHWLCSVMNSRMGRSQVEHVQYGTAQKQFNISDAIDFRYPVPPLSEQEAIAEALSDADALIESLEQLIAKKRHLKQGAMQELLTGKRRLPGFSGEWEAVKAGNIGRFRGGSGFPIRFQGDTAGDLPFFKVSDMNAEGNQTFMETANNYISESLRKQLGAVAFPINSIVFAKVGAAVFLERKKILAQASCLDNNMAAFMVDSDRAAVRFIHYLLLSRRLGDLVSTTALPSLSGRVLAAIDFVIPSIEEQTAIAAVLSDIDTEIAALEAKLAKACQVKQGMMQELLTGRTRLVQS
jgi:type I restriction enzyme S subunit